MIQAGNAHPANTRFTYTVYDPEADADAMEAAGFTRQYGNSQPDLIVVVQSRSGGKPLWLAVECERGNYSSTRLKQKLAKNLEDYATAGFGGCYYIANNRDTARVLGGTITRLRDDLTARPDAISTPGFLALFTLESLRDDLAADAALYLDGVLRPQAAAAQRELARGRRQAGTVFQVHAGGEGARCRKQDARGRKQGAGCGRRGSRMWEAHCRRQRTNGRTRKVQSKLQAVSHQPSAISDQQRAMLARRTKLKAES